MKDYSLRTRNIIKWYEYKMTYPDDPAESSEDVPDSDEVRQTLEEMTQDEEIDLSTAGLQDDEQELIESIMAKFKEAKQNTVDDLFANAETQDSNDLSEEDLIASICAPKQNNVDALVSEANSGM